MKWLQLLCCIFFVWNCGDKPSNNLIDYGWIHSNYSNILTFKAPNLEEQFGFIAPAGNLYIKEDSNQAPVHQGTNLLSETKSRGLFRINFTEHSNTIEQLKKDQNSVAFIQPFNSRPGSLWFAFAGQQDLDRVANIAHSINMANSTPCGRIEWVLPTKLNLINPTKHLFAIFDEWHLIDEVAIALSDISGDILSDTIQQLSSFKNRFHNSQTGLETPSWISSKFNLHAPTENAFVQEHEQNSTYSNQNNVILTITGRTRPTEKVILGAHMDSILADTHSVDDLAPGADDDASGIGVLLEIAATIKKLGWQFHRTVEFHAYGAEEIGLIGSKNIATNYTSQGVKVAAMMQFDMVTYSNIANDKTIYLVTNDTSEVLRRSAKDLLSTYLGGGFTEKRLSGGTSDHRSWFNAGYPALFPFENPEAYNPTIHTSEDTSEIASNIELGLRFTKLGLAFVAHMAGVTELDNSYAAKKKQDQRNDGIFITIDKTSSGYQVWAGVPSTSFTSRLCYTDTTNQNRCLTEAGYGELVEQRNNQQIFRFQDIQISDGTRILITAYDQNHQLTAYRIALFQKNSYFKMMKAPTC